MKRNLWKFIKTKKSNKTKEYKENVANIIEKKKW